MISSILSEPLSERPVDVGLEEVQDQTERLLNRVTTLPSMAVRELMAISTLSQSSLYTSSVP